VTGDVDDLVVAEQLVLQIDEIELAASVVELGHLPRVRRLEQPADEVTFVVHRRQFVLARNLSGSDHQGPSGMRTLGTHPTMVGFGAGQSTFGWIFYPRIPSYPRLGA
jgi:hypothetical protein